MIDLLSKEIRSNFLFKNKSPMESRYIIHCSSSFFEELIASFYRAGFTIPVTIDGKEVKEPDYKSITKIMTPTIGYIDIKVDMDQGYKIEEV